MHELGEILTNRVLLCALTAWFVAQAMKIPTYYLVEHKLNWRRFLDSGGMPSSHTALMVSLTIIIGSTLGFGTAAFALSFCITTIVMYDATGVRWEKGKQGQVLNEIIRKVIINGEPIYHENLKELVGHTHLEVAGGAVIGIMTALAYIFL